MVEPSTELRFPGARPPGCQPKARPIGVVDGQQVDIPVFINRLTQEVKQVRLEVRPSSESADESNAYHRCDKLHGSGKFSTEA